MSWPNSWRKQHACTRCRRQKVRCEFDSWQATICRRCVIASAECVPYIPRNSFNDSNDGTNNIDSLNNEKRSSLEDGNSHTKRSSKRRAISSQSSAYRPAQTIFRVDKKTSQQNISNSPPLPTASKATSPFSADRPLSPNEEDLGTQSLQLFYSLAEHSKRSRGNATDGELSENTPQPPKDEEDSTDIFSDVRKMGPGIMPTTYSELEVLMRAGHISREYCLLLYSQFTEKMAPYAAFLNLEDGDFSFDEAMKKWPRLVHARITVAAINDPKTYSILRYSLRKQLIQMVFLDGVMTSEVIASLIILYTWKLMPNRWNEFRHLIDLPLAAIVGLCSQSAWTVIKDDQGRCSVKDRVSFRLQLVLYVYTSLISLSIPRFGLIRWNHDLELKAKALEMTNPSSDEKLLLALCDLLTCGREVLESIELPRFRKSQSHYMPEFTAQIERLWDEFCQKIAPIEEKTKNLPAHRLYMLTHSKQQLELYLCDGILQKCGNMLTDEFKKFLMSRIVERGIQLIKSFEYLCQCPRIFPTFFFFRPINCLIALIRLKRSAGFAKFDIPLDVYSLMANVKKAWQSLNPHSYAARTSYTLMEYFEEWLNEYLHTDNTSVPVRDDIDITNTHGCTIPQPKRTYQQAQQPEFTDPTCENQNSCYEDYAAAAAATTTTNFTIPTTSDDARPLMGDNREYTDIPPQVNPVWPSNDSSSSSSNNNNNGNFEPQSAKASDTDSSQWNDAFYPKYDDSSTNSLFLQFLDGADFNHLFGDSSGDTSEEWSSLMRMG